VKLLITFKFGDDDTLQCWFDVRNREHAFKALKLKQDNGNIILHAELCNDGSPIDPLADFTVWKRR